MEAKTQIKAVKTPEDKIKELRRENRRLTRELLETRETLEKYKQDVLVLRRHVAVFENIVLDLINTYYGERVRVSFINLELCVDQKCVRFDEYDELLIALRVLPLLVQ